MKVDVKDYVKDVKVDIKRFERYESRWNFMWKMWKFIWNDVEVFWCEFELPLVIFINLILIFNQNIQIISDLLYLYLSIFWDLQWLIISYQYMNHLLYKIKNIIYLDPMWLSPDDSFIFYLTKYFSNNILTFSINKAIK